MRRLVTESPGDRIYWLLSKLFRNPGILEPRRVLKTLGAYSCKGRSVPGHRRDLGSPLEVRYRGFCMLGRRQIPSVTEICTEAGIVVLMCHKLSYNNVKVTGEQRQNYNI